MPLTSLDQVGIEGAPEVLRENKHFGLSELERCANVLRLIYHLIRRVG